jgi:SAM-dependent methyltransferase
MVHLSRFSPQISRYFLALLMPYDLYERHAVVGRLLREAVGESLEDICILDVGGRAELLERFMPYRVISANIDGSGDLSGSGRALPFVDSSFVAVVSIDTLEHLPRESRLPFLRECLRVAQRYVVVAAPFGSEGHSECEKRLGDLYRSTYGKPHIYLGEHIRYGLPDIVELDRFICDLKVANSRRLFAGDYVWQAKQFERAILGYRRRGLLARLWNVYTTVTSLAVFHPIRLRDRPDATANRFYLLLEKKCAGTWDE